MVKLYRKYEEIISYLIIGGLTTVVSLITYYSLVYTILNAGNGIQLQIANILSWIVSVTFAYFTNRKFVFKSNNKNKLQEARDFFASRILTLLIDMFLMFVFVTLLSFNDRVIKVIVQVVVIVINYILSKFVVFKKDKF